MLLDNLLKRPFWLLLLSSLLLILSFPPFNQGYLAWIGLVPFFYYIRRYTLSWEKAFLMGFLKGMLFFIYVHGYIALSVDFFFHPAMGYLVVFLGAAYSAFFTALFAVFFYFVTSSKKAHLSPLAAASAWVLLEYARSLGLLGHTGGFLGYSQVMYPFLLQPASVYGYWGLPFIMVLFQATLCFFLLNSLRGSYFWASLRKNTGVDTVNRGIYICLIVLIIIFGLGVVIPGLFPVEKESESLNFILVQGNIPQEHILDPARAPGNFQRYLDLSKEAYLEHGAAKLVVWPETVFSSSVARRYPEPEQALSRLAASIESPIFFGAIYNDSEAFNSYNSILLQKPGRERWAPQRYDKIRLVPFAEYFPFPDLLNRLWDIRLNLGLYSRGEGIEVFEVNSFRFGGVICFESYFPQPALDTVRGGAEHLFVLTNDAWFLDSIGLDQHAAVAAVRAVETGVGVTQVANTGYTLSFDHTGSKVFELPVWEKEFGLLKTDLSRRVTLYRLWGDFFLWICLGIVAFTTAHRFSPKI